MDMQKEILVENHPRIRKSSREPLSSWENFKEIIANSSDISLLIDESGMIHEIFLNKNISLADPLDHWENKNIRKFLTRESQTKIDKILALTSKAFDDINRPVELNHVNGSNWQIPVSYAVHIMGDGKILLTGRDMRPIAEVQQQLINSQILLEKEYEKYRGFDTRFRVILESSNEGIALIDAESGRITDINTTASHLLSSDINKILNSNFSKAFKNQSKDGFLEVLRTEANKTNPSPIRVFLQKRNIEVLISPILFRANNEILILCKIEPMSTQASMGEEILEALRGLYNDCSDGIIFTDNIGLIRFANKSFLKLSDVTKLENINGKSLSEFMARGVVDLNVLMDNASENGKVQFYNSSLKTNFGMQIPIEVSVTHLSNKKHPSFGYIFRDASRNYNERQGADTGSEKALQNVMKLVGSAPLKELVADTSDVVERLCIETAIELTRNNRVAAAEMLGVSRQSLYVKLRKYNLMSKEIDH
jgi:transcriptional regulator PpsR